MQIELSSLYKNSSLEMVIPLEKKKKTKKKRNQILKIQNTVLFISIHKHFIWKTCKMFTRCGLVFLYNIFRITIIYKFINLILHTENQIL